jgi:hypothetical protein
LLFLEVTVPAGDGRIGRQVKINRLEAEDSSDEAQIGNSQVVCKVKLLFRTEFIFLRKKITSGGVFGSLALEIGLEDGECVL